MTRIYSLSFGFAKYSTIIPDISVHKSCAHGQDVVIKIQILTAELVSFSGRYRMEGKNYEVQDGDILMIKFNVTDAKKK